jgi:hypothetical protein
VRNCPTRLSICWAADAKLSDLAWQLFGSVPPGWQRQAICDYAHQRISFGYHHARGDRTAFEGTRSASGSAAITLTSP